LCDKNEFHGNVKWDAEQVMAEALIWSWQEAKNVTDAFDQTREICDGLKLSKTIVTYTAFMNALTRYADLFQKRLRDQLQTLAEEVGGERFRTRGWVLIGFDGSRVTAPRTASNERAFCAANYGQGKRAKYGKKKSQGLRRRRNQKHPPQPQEPQAWITMLWHMGLRLPWTWRLGPSNSSERDHVQEMEAVEKGRHEVLQNAVGDRGGVPRAETDHRQTQAAVPQQRPPAGGTGLVDSCDGSGRTDCASRAVPRCGRTGFA
jgi:hypothetical protein